MRQDKRAGSASPRSLWHRLSRYFDLSKQRPWDAAHLAVQSALAAVIAFSLMRALGMSELFVGILSAVLVIQPSAGNTVAEAGDRILATIVGSIAGIVCLFLLPYGFGTAIALAVTMLVINAMAGFRPDWRYGVVAGVALALGSESNAVETAQARAMAIGLGAFVGVAVSLLVWPDKASMRASRHIRAALEASVDLLDILLDTTATNAGDAVAETRARFDEEMSAARQAAQGIRFADATAIENRMTQTQRLYQSLTIIERVNAARQQAEVPTNDALMASLDRVRRETREVLERLVAEGAVAEGELDDIDRCVDEARRTPRTDGRLASVLDHSLVFALGELGLSLRNLKRAFDERYEGSMLDWGADAEVAVGERVRKMSPW